MAVLCKVLITLTISRVSCACPVLTATRLSSHARLIFQEASSSKEQSPPNGQNSPLQQTSSKNGVKSSNNEANSNKHRSPMPAGVPLPVAEHESLHTYVQRARNISVFSIVFTLTCAVVGLVFFWSTHRCEALNLHS
jgi:hypothetical protein